MFWRQTPRETVVHLRALSAARARAFELALFTAWHVAALSRVDRLPELAPMLARVRGEKDDELQDADEQLGAARAIVAAFGEEKR